MDRQVLRYGSRASVVVRDSQFAGSPGDVIEEGALGTNARLDMRLENVVAERSTGVGNTWVLPFNNGDCVLAGSLGAGNDVRLTVRDSVLRDCANSGLSMGRNVVNGSGPTRNFSLDLDTIRVTGNRGANLGSAGRTEAAVRGRGRRLDRHALAARRGPGVVQVSASVAGAV